MPHANDEPPPERSAGDILREVIDDMKARRRTGIVRYGTALQPFNGRRSLVDAYQEALDETAYLKQEIREREAIAELVSVLARVLAESPREPIGGARFVIEKLVELTAPWRT
jgi:hypothetical protein